MQKRFEQRRGDLLGFLLMRQRSNETSKNKKKRCKIRCRCQKIGAKLTFTSESSRWRDYREIRSRSDALQDICELFGLLYLVYLVRSDIGTVLLLLLSILLL